MSTQTLLRMMCLLVCLFFTIEGAAQAVDIPDSNLRRAIEEALGKAAGAPITVADMETLTVGFRARDANISNLTGLEHATNLTWLDFINNNISDLSPISGLTNLRTLNLDNNNISDLSPLVSNTSLGAGVIVDVEENPLNAASINTHIPTLQRRGVTVFFNAPPPVTSPAVNIPDPNLRRAVEAALGKAAGAPITDDEMATLTRLTSQNANISDLTGLEHATNLTSLFLENNSASNLSPLSGLTNLRTLYLDGNSISNITPLSGLINMEQLDLEVNSISDVSALAGLTNLRLLILNNNSVSDLSPLVSNTGLGSGDTVYVQRNPLNSQSHQTHIPALQGRGVTVHFDPPQTVTSPTVNIPDPNLRRAVEAALGKAAGAPITVADMETLTSLTARNANISNLTGLEHATNLTVLDLITNSISDLSPISGLTNLTRLDLEVNTISNITAISGLTNLGGLSLGYNSISDVSALAGLTNLVGLLLGNNSVSDVEALAGLTNLIQLYLENNSVSDISPLVANTGLGSGDTVNVQGNPLSSQSHQTHIPALQGRGVTVLFDPPQTVTSPAVNIPDSNLRRAVEAALGKAAGANITTDEMTALTSLTARNANISNLTGLEHATNLTRLVLIESSISDLSPISGLTNLTVLELVENSISELSPISGLTNLTWLNLRNNRISDLSPLVSNTGLGAGATVLARENPLNTASINTHIPTLQGRGVEVLFDAPPPVTGPAVNIPDPNLRRAIEAALGKAAGATITVADMEALTSLTARNANISNLTGLEHATNLGSLFLENNSASNLSPLAGLTNLRTLYLDGNSISNITPLSGLINMAHLDLEVNSISNVSALSGLTNLRWLNLNNNTVSDISPLVSNTGLGSGDTVYVGGNPLNSASHQTHIPTLQSRGVTVYFDAAAPPVNILDPNLRRAIEAALGKAAGATITIADMETLTSLTARNANISNLTGLEHAANLGSLDLIGNSISNLSPLSSLINLTDLVLDQNSISDVSALSGLTNLRRLRLNSNSISNVSALAGLTNLRRLLLYENSISNVSVLSGLTNLAWLNLGYNSISDVSALAGLTNLTGLTIYNNTISDLSPLVANTGLGSGDEVDVRVNPLNTTSINTHIPALQQRGVEVLLDSPQTVNIPDPNLRSAVEAALGKAAGAPITANEMTTLTQLTPQNANISDLTGLEHASNLTSLLLENNSASNLSPLAGLTNLRTLYLDGNSISNITPLSGLINMEQLDLEVNSISDVSALAGLTNLRLLILNNNSVSDLSPLVSNTGLGSGDTVYVQRNPLSSQSHQTHIPALQSRGVTVHFDAPQTVNIPDANLRAAIETTLGKTAGAPITANEMTTLTRLTARDANIRDLTGLEHAANLRSLDLIGNSISNLSPLSSLINLTDLVLDQNSISDVSALSGLTNLNRLRLGSNTISNVSPLSRLTNLSRLRLYENSISDVSALSGLTSLTWLNLAGNSISDVSALAGLTNLTGLSIYNNTISDLSPLVANTGLGSGEEVNVEGNPLNTASINTHIPALQQRGVTVFFDPPQTVTSPAVNIPDPNLRMTIAEALFKETAGAPITVAEMETLTWLGSIDNISNLTGLEHATNLTELDLAESSISDLSPLSGLTSLTHLNLAGSSISDLSPLSGLTNLTALNLAGNSISDLSPLAGLTNLTEVYLAGSSISDLSPLSGLTNLTALNLAGNSISDLSPLAGLTNLTELYLENNSTSNLSPLSGLTNLTVLWLTGNSVSDLSPLAGLTNLTELTLENNSISDLSPLAGLTNLTELYLAGSSISDLSPLAGLTNLTALYLAGSSISDLSPLVSNTGLGSGDTVWVEGSPLSSQSLQTHIPALQRRGVTVHFDAPTDQTSDQTSVLVVEGTITNIDGSSAEAGLNVTVTIGSLIQTTVSETGGDYRVTFISPAGGVASSSDTVIVQVRRQSTGESGSKTVQLSAEQIFASRATIDLQFSSAIGEYLLSVPAGISLIHVPLKVAAVDGVAKTITSIADLYDVLGGADTVNVLITYDPQTQNWLSYFRPSDRGTASDKRLTDEIGVITGMRAPVSLRLTGSPLGTDGSSTITLNQGINLVGVPLKDSRINRVSDLLSLDGISSNVFVIIVSDNGEFRAVGQPGDDGDIPVTGGQSFILTAQRAATVTISGERWDNTAAIATAPPVGNTDLHSLPTGIQETDTTPVLVLSGSIDSPIGSGFRVIVKNRSTGRAVTGVIGVEGIGYQLTVVDTETGRAAQIGDSLEISARSLDPSIGVQPLRYTVTAEDVKRSQIQLPTLVAYEIPAETELLPNYPNPFNPETWIPYQLSEGSTVTVQIYDIRGHLIRTVDVGHKPMGYYLTRKRAIYWDGRNENGEPVSSGVYFYTLNTDTYTQTRRMVIVK